MPVASFSSRAPWTNTKADADATTVQKNQKPILGFRPQRRHLSQSVPEIYAARSVTSVSGDASADGSFQPSPLMRAPSPICVWTAANA